MTTMIEKVARAICASVPGTGDIDEHFSDEFPLARRHWMEMARAAVEAMRTPSPAIIEAAEDIVVGYDDFALDDGNIYLGIPGYPQKATEVWGKLIDAALNEERT